MRAPIISLALYLSALLLAPFAQAETATLQHDNSGNVTQRTTPLGTTNYTYDALNRLKTEAGPAKTQTIEYDENGNRKSDGAGNYTYETSSNRMSTRLGLSVQFDAAGNLTADGTGRTFTYNEFNQMDQVFLNGVLLATYEYDADGLRMSKVTTASAPQGAQSILFEYDEEGHLITERTGTGAPLHTYAWRDDTPVAQIDHQPSRSILYYSVDHLNTSRTAMDSTGKVVWRWESDAFGTTLPDEDPDKDGVKTTVNLRFWGYQYADVESGLFYNGHRYYSPLLKIFTQTDRLDLLRQAVNPLYRQYSEPTDLQRALNQPFNYTGNNPMSEIDPLGLWEMYGNWGGGSWSGGKSGPKIPATPAPPIDSLDACYMQHDYCYASAQSTTSCSANTISSCDTQLSQCLVKVNYSSINSSWGKIFGPYSTWWAAIHGRISR